MVNPLDLLLLACPAMMALCVFGMRGSRPGQAGQVPLHDASAPSGQASETRLADLMLENDELRRRLAQAGGAPSPAAAPPLEVLNGGRAAKGGG